MKEPIDEELQRLAEQGGLNSESLDPKQKQQVLAYKSLFARLKAEPAAGLPFGFAADVRRAVQKRAYERNDLKYNVLLVLAFIVMSAFAFGLLYLISPVATGQLATILEKFKWAIGLSVLAFWIIHFTSQKLLEEQQYN